MRKRAGFGYLLAIAMASIAFVLLMLKLLGPATRWVSIGLYLASWVPLVFAVRKHLRARGAVRGGKRLFQRLWTTWQQEIVAATALLGFGTVGFVLLPPTDVAFFTLDPAKLVVLVDEDERRVQRAATGIARQGALVVELARTKDAEHLPDKPVLKSAWASYIDYAIDLDALVDVHEHFYQINAVKQRDARTRSFLIALLALSEQIANGFLVRAAVIQRPDLVTLLNEASAEDGLAQNSFFTFNQGLTRPDGLLRVQAGLAYLQVLRGKGHLSSSDALAALAEKRALSAMARMGANVEAWLDNPLTYFETKAFATWFPLQKKVANDLGDLRVQDRPYFVNEDMLRELRPRLQPMDVMLERRNWYATNVGLPGFWPHAALYTSSLDELDAYFSEAVVREQTGAAKLSEYLRERTPKIFEALSARDERGDEMRVLEAVGEGVVFQSFEHSGNADYLAVMRPELDDGQKLQSLLRAFSHFGKPYDFDFDFVTDNTIVCSELVFKSLQDIGGVSFELARSAGRSVLTPNHLAQKFDRDYDRDERALGFVAFLEGSEADQTAYAKSVDEFRASWRRPKWDLAQP